MSVRAMLGATQTPRLLAEFGSADALVAAVRLLEREAYQGVDTFTPFDVPEVAGPLGLGRSGLGWVAGLGGVVGLVAAYGIQWWANVHSYPLNAGGRPVHAVPAFVLASFEGTILGAALAAFFGLLIVLRLPRLWSVEDEVEEFRRASVDRFWLAMPSFASDHDRAHAEELLRDAGAVRTIVFGKV
ncbi:MAG TPA: DUF3341 domain-containing protein [Gemmatimonadaceae bacterium]|jgi:hypothetical protein